MCGFCSVFNCVGIMHFISARQAVLKQLKEFLWPKTFVVHKTHFYDFLIYRMNLHPHFQNVQKKAKEFENYPDHNRTDFSRSELARLSKKVLLPNVNERAHEYEVKATSNDGSRNTELVKERETPPSQTAIVIPSPAASNSVLKRIQVDSRSLDSSGWFSSFIN